MIRNGYVYPLNEDCDVVGERIECNQNISSGSVMKRSSDGQYVFYDGKVLAPVDSFPYAGVAIYDKKSRHLGDYIVEFTRYDSTFGITELIVKLYNP